MKLGPLLLLSLLLHGVLLLALRAAPASHTPAPPPASPLVWMQLAAPAPEPVWPALPVLPPASAVPAEPAAPAPAPAAALAASRTAPAAASRSSQPPAMIRSAAPAPAVPDPLDGSGIELPIEAEAGASASPATAGVRAISGPILSVPGVPGPVHAGGPPSAPPAPPFDARAYADFIRRRIDAEKQYPARARRLGLQGVATVLVSIDSRGRLVRPPRLAHTSGVAALDHEALRMVQAAAPFPPPACAAPLTAPLEVQVPVRFSLADAP